MCTALSSLRTRARQLSQVLAKQPGLGLGLGLGVVAPLLELLRRYPPVRNAQLVRAGARRAYVVRAVVPLLLRLPHDKRLHTRETRTSFILC